MEEPKSLTDWATEIKQNKQSWLLFYAEMLGTGVSSNMRFFRVVKLYGFWPVFEAIVESSARGLTGDPLAYVMKVASNKWKESQEEINEQVDYSNAVEQSKKASEQANKALAKRLTKHKGKSK